MVFPREHGRPGVQQEPGSSLSLGSAELCRPPESLDTTVQPPSSTAQSLLLACVPYCKDHLSHGYCVQPAIEVLNPLAQFFFPSPDQAKEVIRGHHLEEESCRKQAVGGPPPSI